jgi:DNA replication protein DnaC
VTEQLTEDQRLERRRQVEEAAEERQLAEYQSTTRRQVKVLTPPRYKSAAIESPELSRAALAVAEGKSDGILLTGPTGVGKTFAGWAVLEELAGSIRWMRAPRVEALSTPELMARCRPGAAPIVTTHLGDSTAHEPVEWFSKAGLLMLDDLGAEKPSEWTGEVLYRIIDFRYIYQRPTVVITNLTPPELAKHLGDRLASRLTEMCTTVVLKGSDRRRS